MAGRAAGLLLAMASTSAAAGTAAYVEFEEAQLVQGRAVWLANCEGCHGYGIAGAPIPMKPAQWEARIARGKAVLYEHALNGFFGPEDTEMPARGGNAALSDDEVRAAVDYMVALANYYIQQGR
jgi:cytochrome c5